MTSVVIFDLSFLILVETSLFFHLAKLKVFVNFVDLLKRPTLRLVDFVSVFLL